MGRDELFERYYETHYAVKTRVDQQKYDSELLRLSRFMPKITGNNKNARILELACGNGYVLNYLKQQGFRDFLGVDFSHEAVELCRQYATDRVLEADVWEFLKMEIEKKNRYDVILMFDSLFHFERKEVPQLFKMCHAILNPGGLFAVKLMNMGNLTATELLYSDITILTGFTPSLVEHMFRLAGFHQVEFDDQKPERWKSRLKYYGEKIMHRFIYWLARTNCPPVISRKFIAIGRK